jgi:DUF971 family protein
MVDHSEKHRSPTRNAPQPLAFRGTEAKEFPILRRLHAVLERLLETVSFEAADRGGQAVVIDAAYVGAAKIEPGGRYAVRLVFDDVPQHGPYTWPILYELCTERERKWKRYLERLAQAGQTRAEPPKAD